MTNADDGPAPTATTNPNQDEALEDDDRLTSDGDVAGVGVTDLDDLGVEDATDPGATDIGGGLGTDNVGGGTGGRGGAA